MDEKLKVLEVFIKEKNNKILIVRIGCESTKETIFLSEGCKMGVDFVSILTLCYFLKQIEDETLVDYYT